MPQSKLHETISTCHHQNITKNQFFWSTFGSIDFQNLSWFLQIKRVSKCSSNSLWKICNIFEIMVLRQRVDAAILKVEWKDAQSNSAHISVWIFALFYVCWLQADCPYPPFPRRAGFRKDLAKNQKSSFRHISQTIKVNIHNLDTLHDSTNKVLQGGGSFTW